MSFEQHLDIKYSTSFFLFYIYPNSFDFDAGSNQKFERHPPKNLWNMSSLGLLGIYHSINYDMMSPQYQHED